ncbi:hypothetical protein CQP30_03035 [Yersinia pestis]|uniref:Uncharacterized protein n=1 Tax=Yersinia pestis TaxID=632 RepID=A0A3G5LF68_YERPE|nr:hypothetical [Yersinia pestis KIM10+]AXY32169.1 hypothetical protein CEQ20_01305 [Yersinia pseudotuberculosis]AYW85306.1 hypothetical protein EGX42_21655 [Yersinia pestis]EIQ86736.1 hypothetical protein YPPY02_3504 [Yersinia pestis PY-02]OSZ92979.1 hypothetical protein A7725_02480 [Yersinia pestis subsp. microtus bv. Caucasica]OUY13144.1 hypothetical protein BFI40_16275 [Yersinia pestis subsp. microtus bv. Altaica]OVY74974.1 hypothetical protein BFI50_15825 [Yersinia pestis subsp. microtus
MRKRRPERLTIHRGWRRGRRAYHEPKARKTVAWRLLVGFIGFFLLEVIVLSRHCDEEYAVIRHERVIAW